MDDWVTDKDGWLAWDGASVRSVSPDTTAAAGEWAFYALTLAYYDPQHRLLAEYESLDGGEPALARTFVYGDGMNEALAMVQSDPNEYLWVYLTDAIGSVMGVMEVTGSYNSEFYAYDAYGVSDTTSAYANPLRFQAMRRDHLTNDNWTTDHTHYRTYHPTLGRWMQTDPIGYVDGMNLYEYVGSNPVQFTDCYGMSTQGGVKGWLDDHLFMNVTDPIGRQILTIYLSRAMAAYSPLTSISGIIANHFIDDVHLTDKAGEMQNAFEDEMVDYYKREVKEYAKYNLRIGLVRRCDWYKLNLKARTVGHWDMSGSQFASTGYWLHGSHNVEVKEGSIRVQCIGYKCTMKDRDVHWIWHDEIDGRTVKELWKEVVGNITVGDWLRQKRDASDYFDAMAIIAGEGIVADALFDKVLQVNFGLHVHWWDQKTESDSFTFR